jgi:hypothetical protein
MLTSQLPVHQTATVALLRVVPHSLVCLIGLPNKGHMLVTMLALRGSMCAMSTRRLYSSLSSRAPVGMLVGGEEALLRTSLRVSSAAGVPLSSSFCSPIATCRDGSCSLLMLAPPAVDTLTVSLSPSASAFPFPLSKSDRVAAGGLLGCPCPEPEAPLVVVAAPC